MAEAKPMQQPANIGTVYHHPTPCQLNAQFIQRQITIFGNTLADPISMGFQLAVPTMALPHRLQ